MGEYFLFKKPLNILSCKKKKIFLKFCQKMGKKSVDSQMKDRIIGLHLAGLGPSEISRRLKSISISTANRTVQNFKDLTDKKRSRRPRKTYMTNDNAIFKIARRNPKYSAKEIAQEINIAIDNHISRQTVNRRFIDRKL